MRVAVVGLGLAGLACARDLDAAGVEVIGVEARGEPGGRVRNAPLDGAEVELGGEWVDAEHARIHALAAAQGRRLVPASPLPQLLDYGGRLALDGDWPDAAEDEARFEEGARRIAADLDALSPEEAARLDRLPLAEFVRRRVVSERGRWLVASRLRSDEGEELDRISTLGWLHGYRQYLARGGGEMSAARVEGGLAGLARRMAVGWKDVRFEETVGSVVTEGGGVSLPGIGRFDRVVLAMPPPALGRIEFDPPLPAATAAALAALPLGRVTKVVLRYERAFWTERGLSGRVLSDGPLGQLWAGPHPDAPTLSAYIVGEASRGGGDLIASAAREIERIFPEAAKMALAGTSLAWSAETLAGGAFPFLPIGFVGSHLARLGEPCGPIHFAGDWCARWFGFAEGALESGERAAREILSL